MKKRRIVLTSLLSALMLAGTATPICFADDNAEATINLSDSNNKLDEKLVQKLTATTSEGTVSVMLDLCSPDIDKHNTADTFEMLYVFIRDNLSDNDRIIYHGGNYPIIFAEIAKTKVHSLAVLDDVLKISLLESYNDIYSLVPQDDFGKDFYNHGNNDFDRDTTDYGKFDKILTEKLSVMKDTDTVLVLIDVYENDELREISKMPNFSEADNKIYAEKLTDANTRLLNRVIAENFTESEKTTSITKFIKFMIAEVTKSTIYKLANSDDIESVHYFENNLGVSDVIPSEPIVINYGVLGNVTGTGEINMGDALMIFREIAGLQRIDDKQKILADTNEDGNVDISDALNILKDIAGLSVPKNPSGYSVSDWIEI